MSLRIICIGAAVALATSSPAPAQTPAPAQASPTAQAPPTAQTPLDAETLAQPREGESASLDLQSIRRFGDTLGVFHVSVVWVDSVRPPPEDYLPRRVRYAVNCDEGTLILAAVSLLDRTGQPQKTMVVPPGASDPVKPAKGSEQAKWVQRVCMF
jgi:hypothetical protein